MSKMLNSKDLMKICEASVVPYKKWKTKNSYAAQVNIKKLYGLLNAGAEFSYFTEGDSIIRISFLNVTKNQLKDSEKHCLKIDSLDDYIKKTKNGIKMDDYNGLKIKPDLFATYYNPDEQDDPLNFKEIYQGYIGGYLPTKELLSKCKGSDWA